MSSEADDHIDSVFSVESRNLPGLENRNSDLKRNGDDGGDWRVLDAGSSSDIFGEVQEFGGVGEEEVAEDYTPWSFSVEGKDDDLFGVEEMGIGCLGDGVAGIDKNEEQKQLEAEEKALTAVLKGGGVFLNFLA